MQYVFEKLWYLKIDPDHTVYYLFNIHGRFLIIRLYCPAFISSALGYQMGCALMGFEGILHD